MTLIGAAPIGQLEVSFEQVRSTKGLLRICLTTEPKNFPDCTDDQKGITRSIPATERTVRFDGLPLGNYALAVIHDENSNAKLDTFAGIPREGFGFSRNPAIRFGPPKFNSARFPIDGGADKQTVRLRYML